MSSTLYRTSPQSLENIRALITTKWDHGYTQRIVSNVESFYVDSSLDNDADTWQIVLGDPHGDFIAMLERNNEIRVELVSSTPGASGHIFSGISDDVSFTHEGVMTITGRDYSSLALDSTCPPDRFKSVQAWYPVTKQARELGFTNISLARTDEVKKTIKTDGSETYWEFWYRLYRNEKMWLWCGPNGALIGAKLNYGQDPVYYFGSPMQTDTAAVKAMHIPVEAIEIRKSTQGRLGSLWVMYKTGGRTEILKTGLTDPTLTGWVKRPFKIINDAYSHKETQARKAGWEEIFEGKVGSLELRLTISDPGQIIRTNQVARVRIPEINYGGDFFVIGWRMQVDSDGFVQEIRLRERYIAMSQRVPREPTIPPVRKLPKDTLPGHTEAVPGSEEILSGLIPTEHTEWGDFFYKAALQWHGGWDQGLFLATILGIAYHETRITNIRQLTGHHDHEEWHPYKAEPLGSESPAPSTTWGSPESAGARGTYDVPIPGRSLEDYHETFCNDADTAASLIGISFPIGVGPMQLTDKGLKYKADDFKGGTGQKTADPNIGMANRINTFLEKKGSPMQGLGSTFVSAGQANNVDPRLGVAISGGESTFGKNCFAAYNAWGMLSYGAFDSWEDGINQSTEHLGTYYIKDRGLDTIAKIGNKWAPIGAANDPQGLNKNWIPTNSQFYSEMGGDPTSKVTYGVESGTSGAKGTANHDEYTAGRWDPEANIWVGAERFLDALGQVSKNEGITPASGDQKEAMWYGFEYYAGSRGSARGEKHHKEIRHIVMVDPGFLKLVNNVTPQIRRNTRNVDENTTQGTTASVLFPEGWPSEEECRAAFVSGHWVGEGGTPADPSPRAPLPPIDFIQAKWVDTGRLADIKYIVIHVMQQDQTDDAAEIVANYFVSNKEPGASHYNIDNNSIVQSAHDKDTAAGVLGSHAGVSFNAMSLHFEHAGWVDTRDGHIGNDWSDEYSQAMLKLSAQLAAQKAKQWGVPVVYQNKAGLDAGQAGFTGHSDVVASSGTGDHYDPGPNFPWATYIQMVKDAA